MQLQHKTALVTGAGVRLGRAMALALGNAGADVAVHYNRSEAPARDVADQLVAAGRRAVTIPGDLSEPVHAAATIVQAAVEALGPLHILVNSAAIFEQSDLLSTTEDIWDRHHDINLKAPFFLSQAFVRQLPAQAQGHIVNIADWRGTRPPADYAAYTPTKAGLVAITRNLALELAPQVRVNAIAPGAILPGPQETVDDFRRRAASIPLRRTGSPDFIADAMLFLLQSEFITGEVIHVTGGESL